MFDSCDSPQAGSSLLINSLLDILFIQALKHDQNIEEQWLQGVQNISLQKPLRAIHHQPGHSWTVESLAQTAGMSRASFAASFKESMGESPLQYLNRWRVKRAAQMIRKQQFYLKEIASRCGFNSAEVFNRTFKRFLNMSPAEYKKQTQGN